MDFINRLQSYISIDWPQLKSYGLTILYTFIITYALIYLVRFILHKFFKHTNFLIEKKEQTIESVVRNTSNYLGFFIIILAMIKPFVDIKNILVAGGVVGIVVGLGAQKIMTDLLAGFFMIFEKQFQRGDFVHVNGEIDGGTVEDMGFRVVKIRLLNGKLMTVPNGEIRKVENGNVERRRIFESVIVSFQENPAKIEELLAEVCDELNQKQIHYLKTDLKGEYLEPYQVHGLSSLYGLRFSIKATVSDEYYMEAAQMAKKVMAQKMYENRIGLASQQFAVQDRQKDYIEH
ncbi:mechanosensitive ion channel family protein [Pradoshia sp. D12]|uniref:mechanosensitive ion channel family protein n=1 Tax=Bacillaceae TaxID=186817 RepID=UPI001128AEE5|nr:MULTISPECIES: mechanosensitive ion channel family protein [Bacillaceae]QFK72705.1 mechanosensitive ion channel family protein [Pradoshia sp. D12]TPF71699.1 mechanosensitive ion channel family protein [Bacillus sp. D12]